MAEPGEYALVARATSASGAVQPNGHDPLCGGYLIRHSRPTMVRVARGRAVPVRIGDAELFLYDMNAYAEENARFPLDVEMTFTGGEGI